MLSAEREQTDKDAVTTSAIELHLKDRKQDREDLEIFRSEKFKNKMQALQDKQNAAFEGFDNYMKERLDLSNSPFVPSDTAKQKRNKKRQIDEADAKERLIK